MATRPTPPSGSKQAPQTQEAKGNSNDGDKPAVQDDSKDKTAAPQKPPRNPNDPKPYEEVITKDAVSKKGVFTVHKVDDKWFFEIPKSELGKDYLWSYAFTSVPDGVDRGIEPNGIVLRWERRDNKILLRVPNFNTVADPQDPLAKAVNASNVSPILMAFDIAAFGKDDAAVIDVTRLYATDGELGPKKGSPDPSRSFIERVSAFPENIEGEVTYTYSTPGKPAAPAAFALTPPPAPNAGTYGVHYSLVRLPEKPMMARLYDDRVGFFPGTAQTNFSKVGQKVEPTVYIARWRLEKKYPSAALSEPVKPIVYYIDPATPTKYVPYIKRAVEGWQSAFEQAGFKNAIIAKEAPTPEQDPNWSAEDVRNTIIRWLPSTTANANGPHYSDPRSGEILNGSIAIYHNVLNITRNWYFIQASPLDARAQKFPFPDELMGSLLEYIVKHEVGHTLGLMHNMKASSNYPQEKLRDAKWMHTMGHCPSIMDYSRFNYVAQPEDHIDAADLIPDIGLYDKWAIRWGYTPIAGAMTPEDERPELDKWAREQDSNPYLRFADDRSTAGPDPGEQKEAVGDADAVKSTVLGYKNLERVANSLVKAVTTEPGEDYGELNSIYNLLLEQWLTEAQHVAKVVGGVYTTNKHVGQDGVVYTPVPAARQRAAMKFLSENFFVMPSWLLKPEILDRIQPMGARGGIVSRIEKMQTQVGGMLVNKLATLEHVAAREKNAYSPAEFLTDLRNGFFKELATPGAVKVDIYRRNLQRSYLDHMLAQLNTKDAGRGLYRNQVIALHQQLRTARGADAATRIHLDDLKSQIAIALDPKYARMNGQQAGGAPVGPAPAQPAPGFKASCWPNYASQ